MERSFARRRQARRLQGGRYEALNPETGITTYTESGFGSRFGIPHYSSVFVGKIRISPCRQSSVPEHCRHRLHGCIKSPPNHPWPAGLAKWRGEGPTGQESRIKALHQARGASQPEFRGFHETRDTKHETRITAFFTVGAQGTRNRKPPPGPPRTPPGRCFPGRCGAAWCGYGAAWAAHCPRAGVRAPSAVLARPHDARRSLGIPEKCTKSRFPQENAPSAALAAVPVALRAAPSAANAK